MPAFEDSLYNGLRARIDNLRDQAVQMVEHDLTGEDMVTLCYPPGVRPVMLEAIKHIAPINSSMWIDKPHVFIKSSTFVVPKHQNYFDGCDRDNPPDEVWHSVRARFLQHCENIKFAHEGWDRVMEAVEAINTHCTTPKSAFGYYPSLKALMELLVRDGGSYHVYAQKWLSTVGEWKPPRQSIGINAHQANCMRTTQHILAFAHLLPSPAETGGMFRKMPIQITIRG